MIEIKKQDNINNATINGEMSIYNIAELKEALSQISQDPTALSIDLSGINEFDSAGVQLLMLLKKERTVKGFEMSLNSHSDAVIQVFEMMELTSYFKDPVLIANAKGD